MPELPEVQTVVNTLLQSGIVGRRIIKAKVNWPRTIAHRTPRSFRDRIKGLTVTSIWRRGKYICVLTCLLSPGVLYSLLKV